jgi:hypothetical protein
MLGPLASKTLLRQIKQLAQQVRQIAAELAQSSTAVDSSGATTADVAAGGGDLSVDANVDFGSNEETENGEAGESGAKEALARDTAAAQTEKPEAESAEAEDADADQDKGDAAVEAAEAVAAQAQQAATAAEREIEAQEDREGEKKTSGTGGSSGLFANSRDEARQKQEDALLVRDLVKELRLLLNLAKGTLPKKDKEDKENLKEIDRLFADIEDLAQELEAAAQSAMKAEGEAPAAGAVHAAVGDAAVSLSVFA